MLLLKWGSDISTNTLSFHCDKNTKIPPCLFALEKKSYMNSLVTQFLSILLHFPFLCSPISSQIYDPFFIITHTNTHTHPTWLTETIQCCSCVAVFRTGHLGLANPSETSSWRKPFSFSQKPLSPAALHVGGRPCEIPPSMVAYQLVLSLFSSYVGNHNDAPSLSYLKDTVQRQVFWTFGSYHLSWVLHIRVACRCISCCHEAKMKNWEGKGE